MDFEDDAAAEADQQPVAEPTMDEDQEKVSEAQRALVKKIERTIKADKEHHDKAFKRMLRDQQIATHGRDDGWSEKNYTANVIGRHVKMKTAALYAKNPKAVARRAEKLDFEVWDEDPNSLMLATQTMQQASMAMAAPPQPQIDPMTGAATMQPPAMPPGYEQAAALLQDFQQGMARRQMIERVGKSLELLYGHFVREQQPLTFKEAAKRLVRRVCTTGVGYIDVGFVRETGPRPDINAQLADQQVRLDHLRRLAEEIAEGEIHEDQAEIAELEKSIAALQAEPEVVTREGLVFDYPRSTKVIPDRLTQSLVGFVGARHLTVEYDYTADEVKEMFGVDLKKEGAEEKFDSPSSVGVVQDDDGEEQLELFDGEPKRAPSGKTVRVWKHFDKPSGLVYYLAEGHPNFLREPAPPDVFVESFWTVRALTFNEVENDKELFPPSDVTLLEHMNKEINRSRQGKREHREAARPRWAASRGSLSEPDVEKVSKLKPFDVALLDMDPQTKLSDVFQAFPVPGVDPNLYDTGEVFGDMQLVAGAQEAQLGGLAKATATESAIAAGSSSASDQCSIDDLDEFLTAVARMSGQILLREMSEEQVKAIVGPGAVWPPMTLSEIASEIYLEVEAGSSGRPNQAVEIANAEKLVPLLLQVPNVNPVWLVKEIVKRLDDRIDVSAAIAAGIPAIVAQNRMSQPLPQDPGQAPEQQGAAGADKTSAPPERGGSDPAFGSNQV